MSRLKTSKRTRLPDTAFAYIDARGRRRLPIHDKAHVRNALARFNQVAFENEAARERARRRLLNAAKKYRIVPVGFIEGQLHRLRRSGPAGTVDVASLPTGFVTFLMTDIEASTGLLRRLGDRYGVLLNEVRGIVRDAVLGHSGREIDARADEYFAVFERVGDAIEAAVAIQRTLGQRKASDGASEPIEVRIRIGIHSGRPTLTDTGYIGLPVHTTARVCAAAHGGQVLVSAAARTAVATSVPAGVRFRSLGRHRLAGLPDPELLFQMLAGGLRASFPRPRVGRPPRRARRFGCRSARRPRRGRPARAAAAAALTGPRRAYGLCSARVGTIRAGVPGADDGESSAISAPRRSEGGTVTPSARAVRALITSSNVVGSSTGRSAGRAPRASLCTYVAARRYISG
jgi:class 3 adenylate cyclase